MCAWPGGNYEHSVRSRNQNLNLECCGWMWIWGFIQRFRVISVHRSIRGLWFVDTILRIFIAFSGFGDRPKHSVRSRDLIHVPNGAVRCGFGHLFVGFVRQLDFGTIRGVW